MPSRVAPIFCRAPLPRPFCTHERASSRWTPIVSNANAITARADSTNSPRPPEAGSHRESPFGDFERGAQLPDLEQPDGLVVAGRHNPEAHVVSSRALPMRPLDESLEPGNRGRRRRDEPGDLFRRQHRQKRRRIRQAQLPKRDALGLQHRHRGAPVRADMRLLDGQQHGVSRPERSQLSESPATPVRSIPMTLTLLAEVPQTTLSSSKVPHTMLSCSPSLESVPQTMLNPSKKPIRLVPKTMLSSHTIPVPHTMLSPRARHFLPTAKSVDSGMLVPQTMLSSSAGRAPHDVVFVFIVGQRAPHDVIELARAPYDVLCPGDLIEIDHAGAAQQARAPDDRLRPGLFDAAEVRGWRHVERHPVLAGALRRVGQVGQRDGPEAIDETGALFERAVSRTGAVMDLRRAVLQQRLDGVRRERRRSDETPCSGSFSARLATRASADIRRTGWLRSSGRRGPKRRPSPYWIRSASDTW